MLKADAQGAVSKGAVFAAVVAVALAVTAGAFLAAWPCTYRTSQSTSYVITSPDGSAGAVTERAGCQSLLAQNGVGTLVALAVPTVLALAGLAGALLGFRVPQLVIGGVILASVLLSSVFMFFLPAGAALITSGVGRG